MRNRSINRQADDGFQSLPSLFEVPSTRITI